MATVYWYGGTGNWSDYTNHWSNNSGNSPASNHGAVPGTDDDVVFDTASSAAEAAYTVTVDATANCQNFTMDGPSTTDATKVTWAGTSTLNIYGSLALTGGTAGITRTFSGNINFVATATGKTVNTNGIDLGSTLAFNGAAGGWTLQNALVNTRTFGLLNGTFDTANYNITCTFSITLGSGTDGFTAGSSSISTAQHFDNQWAGAGSWGTSKIILTGATGEFRGGGKTYYEVQFNASNQLVTGSNTFTTLTVNGTASTGAGFILTSGTTQTVSGVCKITGESAINRLLVQSSTPGTAATIHAAAWTDTAKVDFIDITSTDAIDLSAITGGSGDCGNNTGITFTTADTWYWHADTGNTNDYTKWYTDTNGGGSQMASTLVPLPQDTLRFDDSSFTTTTRVVTQNMPRISSIDFTGATNTPNFTTGVSTYTYGSVTFISGMTLTVTPYSLNFAGRNTNMPVGGWICNLAGLSFTGNIQFHCYTGTYKITGNYTSASSTSFYSGTLTVETVTITTTNFIFNGATARTLNLGASTWLLTGGQWLASSSTTLDAGTSTIKNVRNAAGTFSFTGAGKTYYNFWSAPTGNYLCTIVDSNTFNDFKIDAGREVNFTDSTTTTVTTFTALGTSGSHIVIHNTGGGATHATLAKAGGGVITGCNYIDIQQMTGSPSKTWSIGASSTDTGNTCTEIYLGTILFWVGGTGNWSDATNHWALTSGGSPGAGNTPASANYVFFDSSSSANSYTVTINATAYCKDMGWANPASGSPTIAGSSALDIYGSLTLVSGMTFSASGTWTLKSALAGQTITTAGVNMGTVGVLSIWGSGNCEYTLQDNVNLAARGLSINVGTFNTGNKNITCGTFVTDTSRANIVHLGSSIITCTGFYNNISGSVSTFDCGTSSIILNGFATLISTHTGNISNSTYYSVTFAGEGQQGSVSGTSVFTNLTKNDSGTFLLPQLTTTVTGAFSANGTSKTSRINLRSGGTAHLDTTGATVSVSNINITGIHAVGDAGDWDLQAVAGGAGDQGGNDGIIFSSPQTWYWHSNTGSFSDYTKWYTDTNGGGSQMGSTLVPLVQDTCKFDINSFTAGSQVITQDMVLLGSIDFTGSTNTPEFTTSTATYIYGSITLISGMILTASTQQYDFYGTGTIDSGGLTWEKPLYIGTTSVITLKNDLTLGYSRTLTNAGTLNCVDGGNNWVISTGFFIASNTVTSVTTLGSATHLITGRTSDLFTVGANSTISANTSTIKLTGALTAQAGFPDSKNYNGASLWNATTGAYRIYFVGSNTFDDFRIDAGREVNFMNSTVTTVNTFTALGTSGSHIVIHNGSGDTHATLSKTGGGKITGCDYIDIQEMTGDPDLTWYIGVHSTDVGSTCTNIYLLNASNIKSYNTNLYANIKTIDTNPISNVKTLNTNE